jgi:hypothetical protein
MVVDFANSHEVRKLISELQGAFTEPNDLQKAPVYSSDRQGLIRSVSRYTAHDIPILLLDDLGWRLVTTVGSQQTLRHFLPKIFEEALIGDGLSLTDWWVIAGKLPIAEFDRWTPQQRQLTLDAVKLWIAKGELDLVGLGLDAGAILHISIKDVVGLYDPQYGTSEPWWGQGRNHDDTITFLIEEAIALSERMK